MPSLQRACKASPSISRSRCEQDRARGCSGKKPGIVHTIFQQIVKFSNTTFGHDCFVGMKTSLHRDMGINILLELYLGHQLQLHQRAHKLVGYRFTQLWFDIGVPNLIWVCWFIAYVAAFSRKKCATVFTVWKSHIGSYPAYVLNSPLGLISAIYHHIACRTASWLSLPVQQKWWSWLLAVSFTFVGLRMQQFNLKWRSSPSEVSIKQVYVCFYVSNIMSFVF